MPRYASSGPTSVRQALQPLTVSLAGAGAFSLGINLLMLVTPIYMMQVFDRVLASGNLHTLFWLSLIAIASLAVYGGLEIVRGRVVSKIGLWLECELTAPLIRTGLLRARAGDSRNAQPLRDLAQVRGFLSGPAIHAVFDAPWAIIFLVVLWSMHVWYGVFALASMLVLLLVAWIGDRLAQPLSRAAGETQFAGLSAAEAAFRNAEVVHAMGMTGAILGRWGRIQAMATRRTDALNDNVGVVAGASKFLRMAVQTAILGIGGYLVVVGETTGGMMIAASILLGRALAPVDQAIGQWKQITSVRAAWHRVNEALRSVPTEAIGVRLPAPQGHVSVEGVSVRMPGANEPLLRNISFELAPGDSIAVVGPSAAGKTLLCRVLSGIVPPSLGHVRFDYADLQTWPEADLRPHVGYLPQEVSLFPGTVGENIARFSDPDPTLIVEAARLADVHELILRLPDGYQTDVGELGTKLSGGQRQRIGLARAVFGTPKLVILDEPNSNLDPAGESALVKAIAELKKRRCTVVVVSHKLGIVEALDRTLLLQDGAVQALGPSDKVLSILMGEPHDLAARGRAGAAATSRQVKP